MISLSLEIYMILLISSFVLLKQGLHSETLGFYIIFLILNSFGPIQDFSYLNYSWSFWYDRCQTSSYISFYFP